MNQIQMKKDYKDSLQDRKKRKKKNGRKKKI
jgi:hypothetical protein